MNLWLEVVQLASTIVFSDDEDALVCKFNSNGVYSSQSLYKIVNFRGIVPVHVPAVWHLKIPPRIHFFLWLLSKNKLLTRDNLSLRRKVDDQSFLFCMENESVHHLFFGCVVAKQLWVYVSEVIGKDVGSSFESIGSLWLSNKRFLVANMFCSAALWGLWKLRNSLCYQGCLWKGVKILIQHVVNMLQNWRLLCPKEKLLEFNQKLEKLRNIATRPHLLSGCPG